MRLQSTVSPNFEFLAEHDPVLVDYAAKAEMYVINDPNTCLMKLRQFAEWLARHVAARHAIDTTAEEFHRIIGILRRQQIARRDICELFDLIRLRGNSAIHDGHKERQDALQGLISAFELAIWFHRTFKDRDFDPGPFRPPPNPKDVEETLEVELNALREQVTEYQRSIDEMSGNVDELSKYRSDLEREIASQYASLQAAEQQIEASERNREDLEQRLAQVLKNAKAQPPEEIQMLLDRTDMAASFLGYKKNCFWPLAQVRHFAKRKSRCHKQLMVLAGREDGNVQCFCLQCGARETLRASEFEDLDIDVECPQCHSYLDATPEIRVNKYGKNTSGDHLPKKRRYGFRCSQCGWECLFSAILPDENTLEFPYV